MSDSPKLPIVIYEPGDAPRNRFRSSRPNPDGSCRLFSDEAEAIRSPKSGGVPINPNGFRGNTTGAKIGTLSVQGQQHEPVSRSSLNRANGP